MQTTEPPNVTPLPCAIFHHPDAVSSAKQGPVGRRMAGRGLLQALARHSQSEALHAVAEREADTAHFRGFVEALGWTGPVKGHLLGRLGPKAPIGSVMLPGPSLGAYAWARHERGGRHALCGLTHTVSTHRIASELYDMLAAPLRPGDAVVCTSQAARGALLRQFEMAEQAGWSAPQHRPDLPVIPLGIDTAAFAPNPAMRADWRDRLGLAPEAIAVLSMGRLSIFEKMHPAPLMLAMQCAAKAMDRPLHLLMCGWFADQSAERLHRAMAVELAPDVTVSFPDGRDAATCQGLFRAADIFALPVDNIQETFGIAPIEAMAAGLPAVVSDWNGLAETVRHGQTGLKIPTYMGRPGTGVGIAGRLDKAPTKYLTYLGCVQQRVAVDVRALAEAVSSLAACPDRRRSLGAAARTHAAATYDWANIVPQLEALWADQAIRAAAAGPATPRKVTQPRPPHPDPTVQFQHYASRRLTPEHRADDATPLDPVTLDHLIGLTGARAIGYLSAKPGTLLAVSQAVRQTPGASLGALQTRLKLSFDRLEAALLWLAKFDLVRVKEPAP